MTASESFPLGAVVEDTEDEDPDRAVVVSKPGASLDEWVAYSADGETVTVADDNPDYPSDEEVVVVLFEGAPELEDYTGGYPLELSDIETREYAFPPGRLRRLGHIADGERDGADEAESDEEEPADQSTETPEERLTPGQRDLRKRLDETADVTVAFAEDGETAVLVVEKLGEEYTIRPDGTVEGGALTDRLTDIAADYVGGEAA